MKNILGFLFISFCVMAALKEEYHCKNYSEIFSKMTSSEGSHKSDISVRNQVIYISGLGDFNQSDLETASKEITDVFGFKCEIIDPTSTYKELYTSDNKIDVTSCGQLLNHTNKTVYITNEYIYQDEIVSGAAISNGNFVIVSNNFNTFKKTVLHELGHTLGVGHCDDNKCNMATRNRLTCDGEFCDNCKIKLKLK